MSKKRLRLLCCVLLAALMICVAPMVLAATSGKLTAGGIEIAYSYNSGKAELAESSFYNQQSTKNGSSAVTLDDEADVITLKVTNSTYYTRSGVLNKYIYHAQNYNVSLTLTNNTGNTLKVSYTVAGDMDNPVAGTYSAVLNKGDKLNFYLSTHETDAKTTTANTRTGTVTINSVSVLENVNVQFASSSRGSYDYMISGSSGSVAANAEISSAYTVAAGTSVNLTRGTPVSGYSFYGWMAGNTFLGTEDGTYTVEDDAIIYPVYLAESEMSKDAPFKVGSNYYRIWQAAVAAAVSGGNTVILNRDYELPAALEDAGLVSAVAGTTYVSYADGKVTYKVPYGVTLLIPFDAANTVYTTEPETVKTGREGDPTWTKPTTYRTLTMASGANITVNGAISIPSKIAAANGGSPSSGSPYGACGMIKMNSGSSITVNSGGNLYAWGFITGDGTVTAESGATVYECFQFMDFRGGTATSGMENKVFPFSQYYIQNIEATLCVKYGATVKTRAALQVSSFALSTEVKFIASSGAFLNAVRDDAVITMKYDGSKDRLNLTLEGTCSVSNIYISAGVSLFSVDIDSADYALPLNSNITVHVKSGTTTVKQDLALLPGSKLIIDEGATCTLASGYKVYVYDSAQWGNYCYYSGANKQLAPVGYAPGKTYNRTTADLIDAEILVNGTLDASAGYLYTTNSGANIHSTGNGTVKIKAGTETKTYQTADNGSSYTEISITSAQLKHGENSYGYLSTATGGDGTYKYSSEHKRWVKDGHTFGDWTKDAASHTRKCACGYEETAAHTFGNWAPSSDDSSKHTHTCSVCGYVESAEHTDNDGNCICDVCKYVMKFDIEYANLTLKSVMSMNFAFKQSHVSNWAGCYVVIVKSYADGRPEVPQKVEFENWTSTKISGEAYYYASFTGIAAKEMCDQVEATIYNADGVAISNVKIDSVKAYARRTLENTSSNAVTKTLMVDMLNYGAAAQTAFSYDAENLANADLTDAQKGLATASMKTCTDQRNKGTNYKGSSLLLKENIQLLIAFSDLEVGKTAKISYTNHNNKQITVETATVDGADYGASGMHVVLIDSFAIADARGLITVEVYDGETVLASASDSIESYVAREISNSRNVDLCTAMMKFADATYAFNHQS